MKNTIKANIGYVVKAVKAEKVNDIIAICDFIPLMDEPVFKIVKDGEETVMIAEMVPFNEFCYQRENNECFRVLDVFTTVKGNQFVYWTDIENCGAFGSADYITKVNN